MSYCIELATGQCATKVSLSEKGFYLFFIADSGDIVDGSAEVILTMAKTFTPQVSVVVYSVVSGELLADSVSFNVEGVFDNSVIYIF